MKRNWKLLVCLLMAMLMLTACSGKPDLTIEPPVPESFRAACREAEYVVLATVRDVGEASGAGRGESPPPS